MKVTVHRRRGALFALVVAMFAIGVKPLPAQSEGGLFASRAELEQMLAGQQSQAQGARGEQQMSSYMDASFIRNRLEEGDFHPGDQIKLQVENYDTLSATYIVDPWRNILLPEVGSVALRGVLRSELQDHLTESLARYIRDPKIRTESTIRVVVLGAVGSPGYYSVPPYAQVTDVLGAAGGTTRNAQLMRMRVERGAGGRRIMSGDQLHQAVIAGRTLDQLGIQAGDHIVVPEQQQNTFRRVLAVTSAIGSIVYLVLRVRRL